ncbi:hypothetical protein [Tenacibaculum finnmarkense]|nr:hypothetical protein [Tenacibaculum finnmarkense]MCG8206070.1 hypothetical protein [Tenacibaculum finnmarkense genomovar finnmarkense]MCG8722161.1 hypothetical protein [Tenacibaculum finnmarkense]MCG8740485.1 hypothetical protein [Tenacibaculum finnmarkense]MCG8763786.1 hypothetical protein [Tenacibaculum finnmarkense]MCG8776632.1 hypothetical protein [Tenacibaculum finnmarkense]
MKKVLLILLSIFALSFTSCGGDEDNNIEETTTETESESSDDDDENESESESESDKATLYISLEGREIYENISISTKKEENGNILITKEDVSTDGKKSFDVSEYIGIDLFLTVYEKQGDITPILVETLTKVTIQEGDNNISIKIPAKKVYGAKIKVTKDDELASNIKVYALNNAIANVVLNSLSVLGTDALKNIEYVETDANGIAEFKNLNVTISNKYHFIVISKEPTTLVSKDLEYEEVIIDLDGTIKSGTINFTSVKTGNITVYSNEKQYIALFDENKKDIGLIKEQMASFNNIPVGTYYISTTGYNGSIKVIVKENETTIKYLCYLELTSTSNNSYAVTIQNDDQYETMKFSMEGKSTKKLILSKDVTTKINVLQEGGYAIYPTEKDYTLNYSYGLETKKISFPN